MDLRRVATSVCEQISCAPGRYSGAPSATWRNNTLGTGIHGWRLFHLDLASTPSLGGRGRIGRTATRELAPGFGYTLRSRKSTAAQRSVRGLCAPLLCVGRDTSPGRGNAPAGTRFETFVGKGSLLRNFEFSHDGMFQCLAKVRWIIAELWALVTRFGPESGRGRVAALAQSTDKLRTS